MCKSTHKLDGLSIRINDIVMAKLRGHPAWPSMVIAFTHKSIVKVLFFGANENERFGFVSKSEIILFKNAAQLIELSLKRNFPQFCKEIHEAEIICSVPSCASIA